MRRTWRTILALVPALLAASCGEQPRPAATATVAAETVAVPLRAATPAVEILSFDTSAVPASFPFEGAVEGGVHWRDRAGEHVVLVTWQASDTQDDVTRHDLRGYHYLVVPDSTPRLVWRVTDYAENFCDAGKGLVSNIEVLDLNEDGIAETAFVYNVVGACDVSPIPFKLMLHSGPRKYAVRGSHRVDLGDGPPVGGDRVFDASFDDAPPEFRSFASDLWDHAVGQFDVRLNNVE